MNAKLLSEKTDNECCTTSRAFGRAHRFHRDEADDGIEDHRRSASSCSPARGMSAHKLPIALTRWLSILMLCAPAAPMSAAETSPRPHPGTRVRQLQTTSSVPAGPTAPIGSCWHFYPSGCPNGNPSISSTAWVQDTWGPQNGFTGKTGCSDRVSGQNAWCGVTDVMSHYVEAQVPARP